MGKRTRLWFNGVIVESEKAHKAQVQEYFSEGLYVWEIKMKGLRRAVYFSREPTVHAFIRPEYVVTVLRTKVRIRGQNKHVRREGSDSERKQSCQEVLF